MPADKADQQESKETLIDSHSNSSAELHQNLIAPFLLGEKTYGKDNNTNNNTLDNRNQEACSPENIVKAFENRFDNDGGSLNLREKALAGAIANLVPQGRNLDGVGDDLRKLDNNTSQRIITEANRIMLMRSPEHAIAQTASGEIWSGERKYLHSSFTPSALIKSSYCASGAQDFYSRAHKNQPQ